MLKIDAATPALPIGKSEELEVATPVVAIGYPLDLPETPNCGMVAGFDQKYLGRYFSTTHLRVNLPTQRGEAGAPLLNMKGEVVGIVVSRLENTRRVMRCRSKRRKNPQRFCSFRRGQTRLGRNQCFGGRSTGGRFPRGNDSDHGRYSGGPFRDQARRHSLASWPQKVTQPEDVLDASFFITAGDTVPITVMRGDQRMTFHVQATLHPASRTGVMVASPAHTFVESGNSALARLRGSSAHAIAGSRFLD